MQAVSDFLAYDNGPQKFLQSFFQEALNQTNVLLDDIRKGPFGLQLEDF